MAARNLFVGGWVGKYKIFCKPLIRAQRARICDMYSGPRPLRVFWLKAPDLMWARRALGVQVPKAPAQICLKLLVLLTHTSTPRLYKWLWQWCVRQSLIIVPSRSPGFYWKWYRSNRTRNMPHTVVPQFWPNLWPSWSWSKLFLPGQSWTNIPI